jgi:hypothetical protein
MYLISEPEAAALYCAKILMPRDEYEAEDFLAVSKEFAFRFLHVSCFHSQEIVSYKPILVVEPW